MKNLFGFIIVHLRVSKMELLLNVNNIISVSNNGDSGSGIIVVGNPEAYIISESFNEVTNMIAEAQKNIN